MKTIGTFTLLGRDYLIQRSDADTGNQLYINSDPIEHYPLSIREKVLEIVGNNKE